MGYDVSYHPIREEEMHEWYFNRLEEIQKGTTKQAEKIAKSAGMEEFYRDRYIELLKQAAEQFTGEGLFEDTHGYALAAIQGFFKTYYYTRGSSLTDLIGEHEAFASFTTPITTALGFIPKERVHGRLPANYAAGVWLSARNVEDLLQALEQDVSIKEAFENYYYDGQAKVVIKALNAAKEAKAGLLEASEIVEPNPLDLNSSRSISNLFNCDPEGALLYQEVALEQLRDAGVKL